MSQRHFHIYLRILSLAAALCHALIASTTQESSSGHDKCVFKFGGSLTDCAASVDDVEKFNNQKFFAVLQDLLRQNYFRYYKVNMDKPCPLWKEERECVSKECGIENCDDKVPAGLKYQKKDGKVPNSSEKVVFKEEIKSETCIAKNVKTNNDGNNLDPLDKHISPWQAQQFAKWAVHDESFDNRFCDVDDEDSDVMHYVDLQLNPERYTGYKGNSATRVWKSIYEENCFKPDPKFDKQFLLHPTLTGLCLEKRVFYRIISGLHTSITISIAAHNYKPAVHGFGKGEWVRNVDMFKNRFLHPNDLKGEGYERLKNLYFVYLLELRALHKIAPYLEEETFFTGIEEDDRKTRAAMRRALDLIDQFRRYHFDESVMFKDGDALAMTLKEEFRIHFLNISQIMDCVNCDKCRLWGKLQTHGIGTALKILLVKQTTAAAGVSSTRHTTDLYRRHQLQRNDLVALLNSLGRFASSIVEVEQFALALGARSLAAESEL